MPDMPQAPAGAPASSPAPAGAGAPPGGDAPAGGGITDAIAKVDELVNKLATAVGQSQLPDEVKAAWSGALAALRKAEEALVSAAGGGEADGQPEPDADDQGGPTSMEQGGAKGAVPMSHQSMRG